MVTAGKAMASLENLDEIERRKERQDSATFYSGEDSSNYFIWQPMTLTYQDQTTGHEVWRMTSANNVVGSRAGAAGWTYFGDMNGYIWDAEGKRLAFNSEVVVPRYVGEENYYPHWFIVNTDGTNMAATAGGPTRVQFDSQYPYFHWSPTEPEVYYEFGDNRDGASYSSNILYKAIVDQNNKVTATPYISLPPGIYSMHSGISNTGDVALAHTSDESKFWPMTLLPSGSLDDADGYSVTRPSSTYWGDTPSSMTIHGRGVRLLGDGEWFTFLPSGSHAHWKYKLIGSNADGGNIFNHDTTYLYDFGGEAEPMNSAWEGGADPWCDAEENAGYDCGDYFSHVTYDRWGTKAIYANTYTSIYDLTTHKFIVEEHGVLNCNYLDWAAFSDYALSTEITVVRYLKYNDASNITTIVNTHAGVNGGTAYKSKADAVQSPDGTKVGFNSEFLNNSANANDIFWAVAYYPYPPEITQIAGSGTYVIRFSWSLDSENARGYTDRGWPNETTDDPPAPRETKEFRLWRSSNGTSGWVPVKTVAANPFDKFDFVKGGLKNGQVSYWEVSDTPGDGTWYYAITSVEHSGLESRTLSNVLSSAGSQSAAYPSNPGGVSQFYSNLPSSLVFASEKMATPGHYKLSWTEPLDPMIRYYNIYYSTTGTPEPIQQNRIASVPVGTSSYLDWLADTSADGFYAITSVDYQGNVSAGGEGVDDTESPTTPAGLSAISITSNQVNLAWSASTDNVGVVGYKIYRDGSEVTSSSSTSFIDTELVASTDYAYTVASYDASGNYSLLSQSVFVTTEAVQEGGEVLNRVLVDVGESVKYFKGTTSPGTTWNQYDYDDSSWLSGATGIGFGDGDDATVLSDMQGSYLTVFLRKSFSLTNTEDITSMQLSVDFDDGFVAYLNGQEIARNNVSGTSTYDMPSSSYHEAGTPLVIDVSNFIGSLQDGMNVLSVVGHNGEVSSSDFSLIPRLEIDYVNGSSSLSAVKDFILL